ncbi:MAG TPA: hypothetical protein PKE55_11925, partial [Kiritimatiellia bacterium]|nr:hypothetical protein [Kiritimatiellia bacterium]
TSRFPPTANDSGTEPPRTPPATSGKIIPANAKIKPFLIMIDLDHNQLPSAHQTFPESPRLTPRNMTPAFY